MDYATASKIVQDWTGKPLLESLEELRDADLECYPMAVEKAYHILMGGFRQLFAA